MLALLVGSATSAPGAPPAGSPGAPSAGPAAASGAGLPATPALSPEKAEILRVLREGHRLSAAQGAEVARVLAESSSLLSRGNPVVTRHPMTPEECRARRLEVAPLPSEDLDERVCGGPHMAPLYDPRTGHAEEARACIDRYEFPDLPCEYPVVWVRAREAALLCRAMGKRLCDAHEWEGACAGALGEPDYPFELAEGLTPAAALRRMREAHNREAPRGWAYGPRYRAGVCAGGSSKSPTCTGGSWDGCGSNTYPTGAFPDCRSPLGVFDLHGNAAEHMNLPTRPEEMASRGSEALGYTEMKGSWFLWDSYRAHEDWCRWRAPFWHGSRVMDPRSHQNYHLGFRCCRDVEPAGRDDLGESPDVPPAGRDDAGARPGEGRAPAPRAGREPQR